MEERKKLKKGEEMRKSGQRWFIIYSLAWFKALSLASKGSQKQVVEKESVKNWGRPLSALSSRAACLPVPQTDSSIYAFLHHLSCPPAPSTESKRPGPSRALGAQVHKVGRHGVEYGVLQAVVVL